VITISIIFLEYFSSSNKSSVEPPMATTLGGMVSCRFRNSSLSPYYNVW